MPMSAEDLQTKGYTILENLFTREEIDAIGSVLSRADSSRDTFRKTKDLFAIRQFLKEIPEIIPLIFNSSIRNLVSSYFGQDYFVVKSIYFDKPQNSNWVVAWHQDLTISVDKKMDLPGFGPWTVKQDQYAVQSPPDILENIYALRIHLDDTDEDNGALRVIPGSHCAGVKRYTADEPLNREEICRVKRGGAMIMRPLLLHASGRSGVGGRRVIHIEFSNGKLPHGLTWSEQLFLDC
jgi:ectoine hydroxylase-related dioxygenase (phytanoyl-CoA dioxygenase family)